MADASTDGPAIIVVVRVEDMAITPAAGVVSRCHGSACGAQVHLSQQSQSFLRERPLTIVLCAQCADDRIERAKAEGGEVTVDEVPGAIDAAVEWIARRGGRSMN